MSSSLAGILQLLLLIAALAACYKPLGDYIARIFTSEKHSRVELGLYRVMGIDKDADQKWGTYARSLLAFSFVAIDDDVVEAAMNEPDRGLRSRDAIHQATARILGEDLDALVSYDDRLLKAATDAGLATASPRG